MKLIFAASKRSDEAECTVSRRSSRNCRGYVSDTFPFACSRQRAAAPGHRLQVRAAGSCTEAVATFFLVLVVFGTAVDPKAPRVGGLAIGFVVAADILAIGPLTGGSMNPARSFGPAVASGVFEAQVIYWAAPIVGGIIAALLYEYLFLQRDTEPADHGALRPSATRGRSAGENRDRE